MLGCAHSQSVGQQPGLISLLNGNLVPDHKEDKRAGAIPILRDSGHSILKQQQVSKENSKIILGHLFLRETCTYVINTTMRCLPEYLQNGQQVYKLRRITSFHIQTEEHIQLSFCSQMLSAN